MRGELAFGRRPLADEVQPELERMMLAEQRVGAGLVDGQLEIRAGMREVDGVVRGRRRRACRGRAPPSPGSANARTAGSMAASSAAGVAAGKRQHHDVEIFVLVACVVVVVIVVVLVIVVMIVMRAHDRAHARE